MKQSYSLHKISYTDTFSFSAEDYSRFKFGDGKIAESYGQTLAENFIQDVLAKTVINKQIVVISSPYSFIPTATFALKNYFLFTLNDWLTQNNYPVAQQTKIYRTITYKEDYGELDAEQRMRLIGNDTFYIDKEFIKDKILIFLDDIKITGSHEKMISKMLLENKIENKIYLLYFAELINKSIHPNIENYLNYFSIKTIFDLDAIIESPYFEINTRIVKFILNNNETLFNNFIQNKKKSFLKLLYNNAIGNGYLAIDAYRENILKLRIILKR